MSGVSLNISVRDRVGPMLAKLGADLRGAAVHNAIGAAAKQLTQNHLLALNAARPNRLGGRRTGFYARAARAVSYIRQPDGAMIRISAEGIAQRYHGGTIYPDKRENLSIPARSEAYGKSPLEFTDLELLFGRGGRPVALVQRRQTSVSFGRRRKDGSRAVNRGSVSGGGVFYWLVKSVTQHPDPTVLPADAAYQAAAVTGVRQVVMLSTGGKSDVG